MVSFMVKFIPLLNRTALLALLQDLLIYFNHNSNMVFPNPNIRSTQAGRAGEPLALRCSLFGGFVTSLMI